MPLRTFIKEAYVKNSSLGRFLRAWREQPAQGPGATTGCKSVGGSACRRGLFPCAAPTFGKERRPSASSRGRQRQSDRALVNDLVTLQIGVANWIACGSTPTAPASLQAPTTEAHLSMLELAREQAFRFARASRKVKPTINSGRAGATLVEELRALEKACSEMGDEYMGICTRSRRRWRCASSGQGTTPSPGGCRPTERPSAGSDLRSQRAGRDRAVRGARAFAEAQRAERRSRVPAPAEDGARSWMRQLPINARRKRRGRGRGG